MGRKYRIDVNRVSTDLQPVSVVVQVGSREVEFTEHFIRSQDPAETFFRFVDAIEKIYARIKNSLVNAYRAGQLGPHDYSKLLAGVTMQILEIVRDEAYQGLEGLVRWSKKVNLFQQSSADELPFGNTQAFAPPDGPAPAHGVPTAQQEARQESRPEQANQQVNNPVKFPPEMQQLLSENPQLAEELRQHFGIPSTESGRRVIKAPNPFTNQGQEDLA